MAPTYTDRDAVAGCDAHLTNGADAERHAGKRRPDQRVGSHRLDQIGHNLQPYRRVVNIAPRQHMFGPDAQIDLLHADRLSTEGIAIHRQAEIAADKGACGKIAVQDIHRRTADKLCIIKVLRFGIDLVWCAELLDLAIFHDRNPVGQCHRFDLIVRDVDHCVCKLLVQPLQLNPRRTAQLGIEVRQRLVEQEHIHVANKRSTDGNTLPLAARKL